MRLTPPRLVALVATLVALWAASTAQAAETIYWNNYSASPATLGFATPDGATGGTLALPGVELESPEGMAYDSVTNRIYISSNHSSPTPDQILYVGLDGSGTGVLNTTGATVESPEGVAVDPATRTVYWLNSEGAETIGWAKIEGGGAGTLNTSGATLEGAYRIAIDPVAGRVYWGNTFPSTPGSISYAKFDNSGGGNLNIAGATPPEDISGLAVDPSGGKIYWDGDPRVSFASLAGTGGGDLPTAGGVFDEPYGLAVDPTAGKLYWLNYGNSEKRENALGFGTFSGTGGGITVPAPVDGPQDPVVLKSPAGTGVPALARSSKNAAQFSCSQGTWGADLAGSFVYQAPRTYAYQWTLNGTAVSGATAAAYTATKPGKYACVVTAANQSGSAAQTSATATVKAAKLKLSVKKAKAKAGGTATFKVKAANQGDLQLKSAKICTKLTKSSKQALKAPKCKSLKKVKGRGKKSVTLKVKVAAHAAPGTYKLTFTVKGGKAAKSAVVVKAG